MTTTFKELPVSALFRASNQAEIIHNRGDGTKPRYYGDGRFTFQKRDEFGGHILTYDRSWDGQDASVYYRIEPDNVVETM